MGRYKKNRFVIAGLFFAFFLLFSTKADAEVAAQSDLNNSGVVITEHTTEKHIDISIHKSASGYVLQGGGNVAIGETGYVDDYQIYKGKKYDGVIISFTGKSLGYFPADEMFVAVCGNKGCVERPEGNIQLRLPYFPNGRYAEIYNPKGEKILSIDLAGVAVCNENGTCDAPKEDSTNCLSDCKEIAVAPATPNSIVQPAATSGISAPLVVLLILAILASIGGIIFWIKKRKNKITQDGAK